MNLMIVRNLSLVAAALSLSVFSVAAQENGHQKKNSWIFKSDAKSRFPAGSLLVIIRPEGGEGKWVIESLEELSSKEISKKSPLEPFVVSADFQTWYNYYQDNVANCDSFNVQDSLYKSVCFSQFAEKNNGKALVGLLFGGSGVAGHSYSKKLVEMAINSIDPQQAAEKLESVEEARRGRAEDRKMRIILQSPPSL